MSAPALVGDTWIGTGGRRLSLSDFAGRFLLLDFWTLCCVNCHHVLAELRPIEAEFSDVLTVVGVHSPKFEFEKDANAIRSAVQRHGIDHPVLNDPEMATWRAYGVRGWPTLVLVDPVGEIVGTWSGEGHGHAIAATITELIPSYESRGELRRGEGHFQADITRDSVYVQPGKIEALDSERVLISDSGNHSLAIASFTEPNSPITRIGSGKRGFVDGSFAEAQFNEPYGAVVLPADLAEKIGHHVVIADTVNHALRGINFDTEQVTTLAGTGVQWRPSDPDQGSALDTSLSTPWDLEYRDGLIYIAMAGEHRIWFFDPVLGTVGIAAGTTHEGLVDGPSDEAWFAQPSALVNSPQGIWILDAETSSLRTLESNIVATSIGTGLFDFGHIDGPANNARLQHPLGITTDGENVYIADTYNGAIRLFNPSTGVVSTLARDLAEPSDVCLTPDGKGLLVVESAIGLISNIPIQETLNVTGEEMHTIRPELDIAAGEVTLTVLFTPPPGQKQDDRYGPSTQLTVGSTPPELIIHGSGTGSELTRELRINPDIPNGILHVAARGASCDTDEEHSVCHMHQQDWGVPVRVTTLGSSDIQLILAQ
jgi:thiol-disulfide isomerase/thioredoxin